MIDTRTRLSTDSGEAMSLKHMEKNQMLLDPKWQKSAQQIAEIPRFGRRWHSWSRLDIRPVLWSLRNRPGEWEQGEYTLTHRPSKHEFWTANGFLFYSLYRTEGCSCQSVRYGKFSLIQKFQFSMARIGWRWRNPQSPRMAEINAQFAEHFIAPPTA